MAPQWNYSTMQASEETLNVMVTTLLTVNHDEFDFGSMLGFLTDAVGNESQRTGSVALEAIAVVNKAHRVEVLELAELVQR